MKYNKITSILLLSFLILLYCNLGANVNAVEENSSSNSYFVSTTGNDASGNGSINNPWKTIQKAANMVTAGDTVYIKGGTYYENVIIENKNRVENRWITFQSYNNEEVVIDGRNIEPEYYNAIFYIKDSGFIRLTGLKIFNSAYGGIHIHNEGTNHIRIDNNTIYNCSARGLATFSEGHTLDNIIIEHNYIDFINNNWRGVGGFGGEGVSLSRITNFVIRNNHISRCGKVCLDVKVGSSYGTINHNCINTSSIPGGYNEEFNHIGIYIEPGALKSQNITVFCNVVYGDHGGGIWICPEEPGGSAENISIYNNVVNLTWCSGNGMGCFDNEYQNSIFKRIYFYSNTVYATGLPFKLTGRKHQFTDIQVKNNIFTTNNNGTAIFCSDLNYSDGVVDLSNNLYYKYGDTTISNWNDLERSDEGFGVGAIIDDPEYVNRSHPCDLRLNITSPAINKGTDELCPLVDYNKKTRPQADEYDIGAYEYVYEGDVPVANIIAPSTIFTSELAEFEAYNNFDLNGTIFNYYWDFGDGETKTGKNTNHTYNMPGDYIVTLTVTDDASGNYSENITINVQGSPSKSSKNQDTIVIPAYAGALLVTLLAIIAAVVILFSKKLRK